MYIWDKNPNLQKNKYRANVKLLQIYQILRNLANFQNFTDFYSACDKNVNICYKKLKI